MSEVALSRKLETLPDKPGVYMFKNLEDRVIYVGKALSLKKRVQSYFRGGDGRLQIQALIERIADLDTIVTLDEQQALMLERDLILKFQPRYNIKLKDDRGYLSIRIDDTQEWPRLELVRKVPDDGARYFGPYTYGYELRTLLDVIKSVVPLRTCSDAVLHNRQRPCLEYQIKRCCGPCCLPVERTQYREYLKQAIAILEGKSSAVRSTMEKQMERAAEELRFEDAATLRDRLEVLERINSAQKIFSTGSEDRDIFALYREEQLGVLSVVRVRNARIAESNSFTFSELALDDAEVIERSLLQYYSGGRDIPAEIIVGVEFEGNAALAQWLSERAESKVEIVTPRIGSKVRLLELAMMNAKQHFITAFDAERRYQEVAMALARRFSLRQVPRRIECIDISNFQGAQTVGACVAFADGEPDKQFYRKFKLSQSGKPDDFASIFEVVTRRVRGGQERGDLPDLLVIDGGPPQLREASRAAQLLGASVEIIAIAKERGPTSNTHAKRRRVEKKEERVYTDPHGSPIVLEPGSPVTHLLVRLRDEAHRFVISYHRSKRESLVTQSVLDGISGLNVGHKRRLLKHYGGIEPIKGAAVDEIARVAKVSPKIAERVRQAVLDC